MPLPTIFANLAAGNQPLALLDAMFAQFVLMSAVPCTASGSANAITLTEIGSAPTLTAYNQFQALRFKAVATSISSVTIQFRTLPLLPAFKSDGATQIGNGDIQAGHEYLVIFDQTRNNNNGGFYLEDASQPSSPPGILFPPVVPGGRLSFATGVPVMTSSVTAGTIVYYTPYLHTYAPFVVGSGLQTQNFGGELSQALTDTTKSPAAAVASTVYYMFLWNDAGTYRCTRGPAWTNDTTPGAGNALASIQGAQVNSVAITNGPAANAGLLVGAIRTDASGFVNFIPATSGAPSAPALCQLDNLYNRVPLSMSCSDTSADWTYATDTWRGINGSAAGVNDAIFFLNALTRRGCYEADYRTALQSGAIGGSGAVSAVSIGLDGVTAPASGASIGTTLMGSFVISHVTARLSGSPNLGYHFVQPIERTAATTTAMTNKSSGTDANHYMQGLYYFGEF